MIPVLLEGFEAGMRMLKWLYRLHPVVWYLSKEYNLKEHFYIYSVQRFWQQTLDTKNSCTTNFSAFIRIWKWYIFMRKIQILSFFNHVLCSRYSFLLIFGFITVTKPFDDDMKYPRTKTKHIIITIKMTARESLSLITVLYSKEKLKINSQLVNQTNSANSQQPS